MILDNPDKPTIIADIPQKKIKVSDALEKIRT
jgi:hypothetical protein